MTAQLDRDPHWGHLPRSRGCGQPSRRRIRDHLVGAPGQLPVGGPSSFEFLCPLLKLSVFLDEFLFQHGDHGDASLELVDIRRAPESGLAPCLLAKLLGKPLLQLTHSHVETGVPLQRVCQVGLQGGSADGSQPASLGRRVGSGVNAFEQATETVEEAAIDSGSAGEAGDGDVASDFPTALAAAQNLGWEGRHQRVLGDLHWLQGQPERAAAAYLAGHTEAEHHGKAGEAAHSQALRAFAIALYAPDQATAEIDLAHQLLTGLNLRATTINVRRAELIRDAGSDSVDDQIATLRTELDIAGLTPLTPAIELACAFHQAVLDDHTALHPTLARPREQTSDEDHAYFVDIAQFMADMPVDQASGVQWLDSEQHTRSRWRGLVIARQTHPHAGH
ncbi:hypothetical protein ACIQWL_50020 [Streptomyces mirabilis]|uniref:hypothetical protein n=1 Tax=Streptomyces mirabilis TaxID=68239 RepID=UPI0033D4DCCB